MGKIYVIGSLNIDMVMQMTAIPEKGETVSGTGFFVNCGGKGANQAVACAKAGAETYMVGCVGTDSFGDMQLQSLSNAGVDTRFIRKTKQPTGTASIWVCDGDNRIVLDSGANACMSEYDVDRALETAQRGDFLILQFEIPEPVIIYALRRAKDIGMHTVVNPAPARRCDRTLLEMTDDLIPNEKEYSVIFEENDGALSSIVQRCIVTLGEKGARIIEKEKNVMIPAFHVDAIDTTAAGDTFIGYYVSRLLKGKTVEESVVYACGASALAVGRSGAQDSIPLLEEVEAFLKMQNVV